MIVLAVLLGLGLYLGATYNSFISLDETVENKWAQVETQYQRRYDLIPNLVESVKGVMKQEKEIFQSLAEARTRYAGASSVNEKAEAATNVESALGRLLVIMERYPNLRSSESVQTLMAQLEGTENRISVERKRYNDTVTMFNKKLKRVPSGPIGRLFGFEIKDYFQPTEGSENAPEVNF